LVAATEAEALEDPHWMLAAPSSALGKMSLRARHRCTGGEGFWIALQ
jgi:hypothetical protein